jgi:hypothetical protein
MPNGVPRPPSSRRAHQRLSDEYVAGVSVRCGCKGRTRGTALHCGLIEAIDSRPCFRLQDFHLAVHVGVLHSSSGSGQRECKPGFEMRPLKCAWDDRTRTGESFSLDG